jgi:hypothetical protein
VTTRIRTSWLPHSQVSRKNASEIISERNESVRNLLKSDIDLEAPSRSIVQMRDGEINEITKRLNAIRWVMTEEERQIILNSMGIDEEGLMARAVTTAKEILITERCKMSKSLSLSNNAIASTGKVSYREVSELYQLVIAIKNKVLFEAETDSTLIFEDGISIKDLSAFTMSVNNLYGTFMRSRDVSKLYDDINKITEAIKQAMKIMPREAVEKFTEVLSSFEND